MILWVIRHWSMPPGSTEYNIKKSIQTGHPDTQFNPRAAAHRQLASFTGPDADFIGTPQLSTLQKRCERR